MAKPVLTQQYLKEILSYDKETGIFTWLLRIDARKEWNTRYAGKIAGNENDSGYWIIEINNCRYRAHQLAVLYVTGSWPQVDVDHIDTNRKNNRWGNLRLGTRSDNCGNGRRHRDNKSGFKGVFFRNGWRSSIMRNGTRLELGKFPTKEDAARAYAAAAVSAFGEFARFDDVLS